MSRQASIKIVLYVFLISIEHGIISSAIIDIEVGTLKIVSSKKPVPELKSFKSRLLENGSSFSYDLSDGQYRDETVQILNKGTDDEEVVINGTYGFKADNGYEYVVKYIADRNGYNATINKYLSVANKISNTLIKSLIGR